MAPRCKKGRGITDVIGNVAGTVVNKVVDLLPVEMHLPNGYRYCGPGTKLKERLARGDPGINKLDDACKDHDIAYSKFSDNRRRRQADQQLADRAWSRVKASDASVGEKAAAWAVTTAMNAKMKLGGGKYSDKMASRRGQGYYLKPYKGGGVKKKKPKKKCGCAYYLKPSTKKKTATKKKKKPAQKRKKNSR